MEKMTDQKIDEGELLSTARANNNMTYSQGVGVDAQSIELDQSQIENTMRMALQDCGINDLKGFKENHGIDLEQQVDLNNKYRIVSPRATKNGDIYLVEGNH